MMTAKATSMPGVIGQIAGALLVLAGVGLAAMTARGLSNYHAAVGRHGGDLIELGADASPQPGQHGYMARIVGTPSVVETPHDQEFSQHADTPLLTRHVEMFQWREIRIGDDVHYELDWEDHPIDTSRFRQPGGHANPGSFPIAGKQFEAGLVQIGGFKLSSNLLHALPGSERIAPDPKSLPANLAASFSEYDGYLVTSAHPQDPRLGDLRVSWDGVPLQPVTVVARIDGDRLVPAIDAADGKGYDVEVGDVSLLDEFPDLPIPPESVLIREIISVLLAAAGAFLLIRLNSSRRDALLALAIGSMAVGAVTSVMYLGSDGHMAGIWLLIALLGIGVAIWRLRRHPSTPHPL
ncbi:TMEM43 family protein [Rhodanobacter sp. L36]|uniref:TMEM43 family protein n=1 Tax=Rhodanobacter sp. L36 TaxID=1747221 RepID=UPI00131C0D72|nr:TMEM43 family protein [Rhodanobacter sp. L36]